MASWMGRPVESEASGPQGLWGPARAFSHGRFSRILARAFLAHSRTGVYPRCPRSGIRPVLEHGSGAAHRFASAFPQPPPTVAPPPLAGLWDGLRRPGHNSAAYGSPGQRAAHGGSNHMETGPAGRVEFGRRRCRPREVGDPSRGSCASGQAPKWVARHVLGGTPLSEANAVVFGHHVLGMRPGSDPCSRRQHELFRGKGRYSSCPSENAFRSWFFGEFLKNAPRRWERLPAKSVQETGQ